MADWTIAKFDGYVATTTTGYQNVIAIDGSSINDAGDYWVAEVDMVCASIFTGASEGGVTTNTGFIIRWGSDYHYSSGVEVEVGANAAPNLVIYYAGGASDTFYIRMSAATADPTQHQIFATLKIMTSDQV